MIKIIKQLVNKNDYYLFSVSMGIDSVSAFIWMKNKGYNVFPIHYNHNLRPQNDLMQRQYMHLCQKFVAGSNYDYNPISYTETAETGPKTEVECRNMRLSFYDRASNWFKSVFRVKNKPRIITAHHLDDYVESYILNCFRGHPTHVPIDFISKFENYEIVHPFILTKKKDFRQYLERNNYMKYVVQDETNTVTKGSRRNWIRNTIIPEMYKNKLSLEKYAKRKIEFHLNLESFVLQ